MAAPLPLSSRPARALVAWCPNWSIEAVGRTLGSKTPALLALTRAGRVVAVSPAAADEAVTPGLRIREAQVRCPDLVVLPHDPEVDERHFAPVLRAIEKVVPHVHVSRPGTAALRITGAARFYGGEDAVAEALFDQLGDAQVADVRMAIADGLFAAEQAAYATSGGRPYLNLSPQQTAQFLRTLPVDAVATYVEQPELAKTLRSMGIRHLGSFAELPREQVHARFGPAGLRAHRLAGGHDSPLLRSAPIPDDLSVRVACDPTSDIGLIARTCLRDCRVLTERLRRAGQVCHEIRVSIRAESGMVHERRWRHTWPFGASEMTERVRWQLEDLATEHSGSAHDFDGVTSVTIYAESPTAAGEHAQGLWGERPDEHIVHTVTGLQHELGHAGVCSASLVGGRLLHERQEVRPWGEAPPERSRLEQPWPGTLPGPAPATVFNRARPAEVCAPDGDPVTVDPRGNISGVPARWRPAHDRSPWRAITHWGGPWPVRQHWWQKPLQVNRFQVVDEAGEAWLLIVSAQGWWIEARYD